jgi:hypothetical protein
MIAKMPAAGFASIAIPLLGHRKTPTAAAAGRTANGPPAAIMSRNGTGAPRSGIMESTSKAKLAWANRVTFLGRISCRIVLTS